MLHLWHGIHGPSTFYQTYQKHLFCRKSMQNQTFRTWVLTYPIFLVASTLPHPSETSHMCQNSSCPPLNLQQNGRHVTCFHHHLGAGNMLCVFRVCCWTSRGFCQCFLDVFLGWFFQISMTIAYKYSRLVFIYINQAPFLVGVLQTHGWRYIQPTCVENDLQAEFTCWAFPPPKTVK